MSNENQLSTTQVETSAMVLSAQVKALIEARYTVAINRPRDLDQVREKILKNAKRIGFATTAIYKKPLGGTDSSKWPTGPSIRFAEAAIQAMGNITIDTVTVYDDTEKRIVRVTVTDLEANIPYSQDVTIQKTVERRFLKSGEKPLSTRPNSRGELVHLMAATDDDILNKQNALISKAIRTLGLRLVPGDLIEEGMYECRETQKRGDRDPDSARLRIFDAFGAVGINVDQLKEFIGHDAHTLTPKELGDLRAIHAAIKDGESTWREVMDARRPKAPEPPAGVAGLQAQAAQAAKARGKSASEAVAEGAQA